jgi:hypothetical protein
MKVRAETQAQAKRETSYRAALRSYTQILKPGMKRKEVENYLRANKIAFQQQSAGGSSLYDITQIGQDESTAWFCGKSKVFVKFHFTTFAQREHQFEANEGDTLDEITLFHLPSCP